MNFLTLQKRSIRFNIIWDALIKLIINLMILPFRQRRCTQEIRPHNQSLFSMLHFLPKTVHHSILDPLPYISFEVFSWFFWETFVQVVLSDPIHNM